MALKMRKEKRRGERNKEGDKKEKIERGDDTFR